MSEKIPQAAAALFELLSPFSAEDRQKVVRGALAMLGEPASVASSSVGHDLDDEPVDISGLGVKARKWLKKFDISTAQLEHVFHFEDGSVEILDIDVPGSSKKLQTINSYLLLGAQQYLATDKPSFDDKSAMEFCKRVGCHDKANHALNRNALGNKVTGTKGTGFTLSAPGLKAAADAIKQAADAAE